MRQLITGLNVRFSGFEDQAARAIRNLTTWIAILSVALVATIGIAIFGLSKALSASDQANLATRELAVTQHRLVISQKASTTTRVSTVQQRCDLTALLIGVLSRVKDSPRIAPAIPAFTTSYNKCEQQLAQVRQINAHTLSP